MGLVSQVKEKGSAFQARGAAGAGALRWEEAGRLGSIHATQRDGRAGASPWGPQLLGQRVCISWAPWAQS